jgi:type I restriction enzyme R subunit
MPIETTDTSEKGLEALIERRLIEEHGYQKGHPQDFDATHALDPKPLFAFLRETQPDEFAKVTGSADGTDKIVRRLHDRLRDKGLLHVLRKGIHEARTGARFDPRLRAKVLNKMTRLGMPETVAVAA